MKQIGNILIVGSNRGIGLALVKEIQVQLKPRKILATYRNLNKSQELFQMADACSNLTLIKMDAEDESKLPEIVHQVDRETNGEGLNLLICNAGISQDEPQTMDLINKTILMRHFEINTVAPAIIAKAFLPLLQKAARATPPDGRMGLERSILLNISSQMGSFGDYKMTSARASGLAFYAYRTSKAALNMLTRGMSEDFKGDGILVLALHPGSVQTELGFPEAPLTAQQSAQGIVKVVSNLNETQNGKFLQFDGQLLPW